MSEDEDEPRNSPEVDDADEEWPEQFYNDFDREFGRLKSLTNYQRRGYDFQDFVGSLFKHRHFMVSLDPGTARPRQTDLLVTRGEEKYLVETKWRRDKANIDDVDSLFIRLESTPSSVIGVLVSYSGFTGSVVARVEERSGRPILLLDGNELEGIVRWDEDIAHVLERKKAFLLTHRKAFFGPIDRMEVPARVEGLVVSSTELVLLDGSRPNWISGKGGFGQFVYAQELPDIDWQPGQGRGVALDMRIIVHDQAGIFALLRHLSDMGWTSGSACWSIQQMSTNWSGLGAREFADALSDWQGRYRGIPIHHSEEFCYFDQCDGGFYALTSNISAHQDRSAHYAMLSFQLSGIPLDAESLRQLARTFDVGHSLYFRPLRKRSVKRRWNIPVEYRLPLIPVAFIVNRDGFFDGGEEWVSGIVATNPFYRPDSTLAERVPRWLPAYVFDSELMICSLRSWHPLSQPKDRYQFWGCESARTAEAVIVQSVAEWPDQGEESIEERAPRFVGFRSGKTTPNAEPVEVSVSESLWGRVGLEPSAKMGWTADYQMALKYVKAESWSIPCSW